MDLDFFRRAGQRLAAREPAMLDFSMLVAMLRLRQAASPGARAQATASPLPWQRNVDSIVELLSGGTRWREASLARAGSFSPRLARQHAVNANEGGVYLGVSSFLEGAALTAPARRRECGTGRGL